MKKKDKHPLWIRWAHWVNFPLLFIMIWSGAMIYWANDVYWPPIPEKFFGFFDLARRLAEGMSYHFFFMWFFAINGLLYFFYLIFSGEWREVFPKRNSFRQALNVVLHDLGVKGIKLEKTKFNGAQRIAYTSVIFMGFCSLVSGLAIYKPVQLSGLQNALGGYEIARRIHFYLTLGFVLFFFIHIMQVVRSGWANFQAMVSGVEEKTKKTPRSFVALGLFFLFLILGFQWLTHQPLADDIPGPLRAGLELNEKIWKAFLNPNRLDQGNFKPPPRGKTARVNGDVGLDDPVDPKKWKMEVITPVGAKNAGTISVTMADLLKLPRTDLVNNFRCIEGWSEVIAFSGVRFIDFLNHYHLGTHSGEAPTLENENDLFSYVGLETPDGEYYVSIDMKSMLSPQTLLAYEMNGIPLIPAHGAPLRLAIPSKYGVKNLKRIGKITFGDQKFPDYWGEKGYDWFIGL